MPRFIETPRRVDAWNVGEVQKAIESGTDAQLPRALVNEVRQYEGLIASDWLVHYNWGFGKFTEDEFARTFQAEASS